MRIIAALDADLDRTPLGTRSRLADDLAGRPVLLRTVLRLAECPTIDATVVCCPPAQADRVKNLLTGAPAIVQPRTAHAPPYQSLVRAARKWSLDGWRGGLGGSSGLDEYTDTALLAALAKEHRADALAVVPPGAALVDPKLCTALIDRFVNTSDEMRMTFTQAPPGLAPTIYNPTLLQQLSDNHAPPGWTLAYKPSHPEIDLVYRSCCYPAPQAVRYAAGRLTADTSHSMRTLAALLESGQAADAESIGRWLIHHDEHELEPLPREVEIELTTADSLPDTRMRPRGQRVPTRGPLALDLIDRLAAELAADDDSLVVLGGHGDPVLHPQFEQVLATLRGRGIYGLAVYTTGQSLPAETIAALVRHRVDVVAFLLDAWRPETYAQLHPGATLATAKEALDRLVQARTAAAQAVPICVPHFTKCRDNVEELDEFYDGWINAVGCATVVGYSHFGGRLPDLTVMDMSPPTRFPCRRLRRRCLVLADGAVVPCDQDYTAQLPLGHLSEHPLADIWSGPSATSLRRHHDESRFAAPPLCGPCQEWHRP